MQYVYFYVIIMEKVLLDSFYIDLYSLRVDALTYGTFSSITAFDDCIQSNFVCTLLFEISDILLIT